MKKLSVILMTILLVVSGSSLLFPDVVSNAYQKDFPVITSEDSITTLTLTSKYKVIGWNDLGMHCISPSFKEMAILPPFNNLFVQVMQKGDPPKLATTEITVEYYINNNTTVSGKTDFWQYVQQLFGVILPEGIGLTGNGLSGTMQLVGDHFEATGIPILPYKDSMVWNPYQTAIVTVKNASGAVVASTKVVIPVSDELNCSKCHGALNTEVNILTLHDTLSGTTLMSQRPVLCASCHSSNALGTVGTPGLKSLSEAMHGKHAALGMFAPGCYDCHPGQQTRCNRSAISGMDGTRKNPHCENCHGTLQQVADSIQQGRAPWLQEPTCEQCHGADYSTGVTLYRNSKGHGGLYCAACHNSPHAWYPSKNFLDNRQPMRLQGTSGPISRCTICHVTDPGGRNPHKAVFNGHPADWYTGHRNYAETRGVRSCKVCHGTDLTGGSGPSCYTCHGPVWRED